MRNKDKPWFDNECRHAFGLKQEAHLRWTCDRSRVNWEVLMKPTRRLSVSLVTEKEMFLLTFSPLISGGPL